MDGLLAAYLCDDLSQQRASSQQQRFHRALGNRPSDGDLRNRLDLSLFQHHARLSTIEAHFCVEYTALFELSDSCTIPMRAPFIGSLMRESESSPFPNYRYLYNALISLTNITLMRGRDNLLEDTSLNILGGRRIALIGRNGCGKSSLFAMLMGKIAPETGDLGIPANSRIANMAQEVENSERSALDYVLDGHKEYRRLQLEIDRALEAENNNLLGDLYETFETVGGYAAEHQAAELLNGLGFAQDELANPVSSFSGGWRIRLNLAQALIMPSDIMLLDEPTNHLDLDTTFWLEQRLKRYEGTLIIISHDRDFIDQVAHEIVHIENKNLHLYKGNYSAFERQRSERLALQQANYVKQQRQIKHIQSFITRFKAKASKAKQAQSRVKQLDNMEIVASAQIDSPFSFRFLKNDKMSNPLINLRDVRLGYGDTTILSGIGISLSAGDRIGLLGVNGAGKSTLIKSLTGDIAPQKGELHRGDNCHIGYFAQHQLEALDVDASALLHIQRISPNESEQKIRNFLGGFDFHGDKAVEPIAPFSGGEKARLALALIVWQKPNLLLLDEPTNHLDLDMRSALTLAMQEFEGALVVVSHDRHLLRHSVDSYLIAHEGKIAPFDGTLEDYHRWISKQEQKKATGTNNKKASKADTPSPKVDTPTPNKKAQRQQTAEERKATAELKKRVKRVEQKIEKANVELEKVEQLLANSELYDDAKKAELTELIHTQANLKNDVASFEESWLALQEQLESESA